MSKTETSVPLGEVTLLQRIKETFPALNWASYKYIDEGWNHEVLILDDRLVFRFPIDDDYLKLLKTEIEVLEYLNPKVKVAIPRYEFIAPDFSFAGYTKVMGQTLTKRLFDTLSTDSQTEIARQLAEFLSTIHGVLDEKPSFSKTIKSYMKEDQAEVREMTEKHLKKALSQQDYQIAQSILSEVDELIKQPLPQVFVHGDVYHSHIFWDEAANRLGIIDFSDRSLSDPAFDFAEIYEYGQDFVNEAYRRYTGPKDPEFLDRAWTYQRWMSVYMMTDHFEGHKTTFEVARETFDRVKANYNHISHV